MHTGEKIRKIRVLKGISQDYMASQIGISQNSLSKIELGETKISEQRLIQISKVLGVSEDDIKNFDDKFIFQNHNTLNDQSKLINVSYGQDEAIVSYKEQIALLKEQCEIFRALLKNKKIID